MPAPRSAIIDPHATPTTHPLVRNHYLARLTNSGQATQTHGQLKDYYLTLAGDTPHNPTMEQLAPLIEVVYHACRAGAYDEAYRIRQERIQQGNRRVLANHLGAFETMLSMALDFFPEMDIRRQSLVSDTTNKRWILNNLGRCLMHLGRLAEAEPIFQRHNAMCLDSLEHKSH